MKIRSGILCLMVIAGGATVMPASSFADDGEMQACGKTTRSAFNACLNEAYDDFWIASGKCQNESDWAERRECLADARSSVREFTGECGAQREARAELCDALGQAAYDPRFEPEDFVDPDAIGGSVAANPWFPLISGRTLVYESPEESVRVTVTDEIKVIDDVACRVVIDLVTDEDGEIIEDTRDWYAQDVYGAVWYCGEATAEYEEGFPASTDGSFQAGVDGARPGVLMPAFPAVGDVYRQEFDLGNAEDAAEVIDLNGTASVPAAACAGDCLVTAEFTPIEPDVLEHKYYKAGVGNILTVDVESGERTELVEIID